MNIEDDKINYSVPSPFYFIIPVWGDEYVSMAVKVLLRNCLSPNNIPAIENLKNSKVIFVSDKKSYKSIADSEIFPLLKEYIEQLFIPIEISKENNKYSYQTMAYMYGTQEAQKVKAVCVYLAADVVISDGAFSYLQKLVKQGRGVYHIVAPRINKEDVLDYFFNDTEFSNLAKPLDLPSRKLASICLDFLHEEYRRYNIEYEYFVPNPHLLTITPPGQNGLIIKAFQQHPLLVDLSKMPENLIFNCNTALDIDFINDNLVDTNLLYNEHDSDNIMICSLTGLNECVPVNTQPIATYQRLEAIKKGILFMLRNGHVNKMHEHFFINTYKLHTDDLSKDWIASENELQRFNKIMRDYHNNNGEYKYVVLTFISKSKQLIVRELKKYTWLNAAVKLVYTAGIRLAKASVTGFLLIKQRFKEISS